MPLKNFKCPQCGNQKETFKKNPKCKEDGTEMEQTLGKPDTKFMEPRGPEAKEKGKSVMKGFNKIAKERARNHSREVEIPDLIESNDERTVQENKWLNDRGEPRKKIDDL